MLVWSYARNLTLNIALRRTEQQASQKSKFTNLISGGILLSKQAT